MLELGEYFQTYILLQREKYQWLMRPLAELKVQIQRIANFGCGEGRETLALMCMLGACEASGVDKEKQNIRNAQSTLKTIQNIIWARGLPSDAPVFLRRPCLEEVVKFYPVDIAKRPTDLPSNYYDFAFCDFVLYHIWLDQGEDKTQTAIREMVRVARLGGVVAAREPTQRIGESAFEIDFGPLFKRSGLKPIHVEPIPFDCGQDTEYLYLKESTA
jgi:ubiquinone/menaquinone biosynthesis C-methylase UbiE